MAKKHRSHASAPPPLPKPPVNASAPTTVVPDFAIPRVQLYAWQLEALESWVRSSRRGIIEAVTGAGKTMVGIAAIEDTLRSGGNVLVLVPAIELMWQWTRALRGCFPGRAIGQLGDGVDGGIYTSAVLVAVVNSARSLRPGRLAANSLLVADECHRYGSQANAEALNESFGRRLGLSATCARSDDGNAQYLDPYFGPLCYRLGYARAIADDVMAHFNLALVGVLFTGGERKEYDAAERQASEARRWLVQNNLVREHPFGEFMKDVGALSKSGTSPGSFKARSFLKNFDDKRRVLAETAQKRERLRDLIPAFHVATGAILFTQTIDAAEHAASVLRRGGIDADTIHSDLEREERQEVLRRFKKRELKAIIAPRVLDEGIDVPEADLGVIVSASQTRRQMIQRMGRVLRKKGDGRVARFVILYAQSTSEDPALGAHEDFLEEVEPVADQVRRFDHTATAFEICSFLSLDLPPGVLAKHFLRTPPGRLESRTNVAPPRLVKRSGAKPVLPGSRPGHVPSRPENGNTRRIVHSLASSATPGPQVVATAPPIRRREPAATESSAARSDGRGEVGRCKGQTAAVGSGPAVVSTVATKPTKKQQRNNVEAEQKRITVDQLIAQRREEAAANLRLHEIATRLGMSVKQLRKRDVPDDV